jgi:hypothetical protein
LCFLWFFAQAKPSAWLNNAKKPISAGFSSNRKPVNAAWPKLSARKLYSQIYGGEQSKTHLSQSASSADEKD